MTIDVQLTDNDIPPKVWIAKVDYINKNGLHIFTSEAIPGLLIASRDAEKAFNLIAPSVEALVALQHEVEFKANLCLDYKDFARKHIRISEDSGVTLKDTYVLLKAAA